MSSSDRRIRASLAVGLVWGMISLFHGLPETQIVLWGLTAILTLQSLRMGLAVPITPVSDCGSKPFFPTVSIIVPAKNESLVLASLVTNLFQLDYPSTQLEVWIVDDGSTDNTPQLLRELQKQYPLLKVHRRNSKGGKSGALNSVFPFTMGAYICIFDADAQVSADFLRQTIPLFQESRLGGLQVHKNISNQGANFLTYCQQIEMDGDGVLQQHRLAVGGTAELHGNGMILRRECLERCRGWNEASIADDLDLTFKLYLLGIDLTFVAIPSVYEEGVLTWQSLWQQRCRWVEGGFQRYLDYFPHIFTLSWAKGIDITMFFILQFLLPVALIPDVLWATFYSHATILWPLQTLLGLILIVSLISGLSEFQHLRGWPLLWATLQGSIYMLHWIPVMAFVILRMCWQSVPSPWVKTEHVGVVR